MVSKYKVHEQDIRLHSHAISPDITIERNVRLPMRDHVTLSVNVFHPSTKGPHPVILAVSPYGKDDASQNERFRKVPNAHLGEISISDVVAFEAPDPDVWCKFGYIVIQGDTRGQGLSDGDTGPFAQQDQEDYYDLIEWAGTQSWCTGAVGLLGVSYLAISQWSVAPLRPPHLKAIVPWEGWNDFYRRFHFGGIPETGFMPWLWDYSVLPAHNPKSGFVQARYIEDAADHPLRDQYWIDREYALERIEVPALINASFSDQGLHTRDTFEAFKTIGSKDKWLVTHRQPKWESFYSTEARNLQKLFLDFYLRNEGPGLSNQPKVTIRVHKTRSEYTTMTADSWPVPSTSYMKRYVNLNEATLDASTIEHEAAASYVANSDHGITLDFRLDRAIKVVGNSKLRIWVSSEEADDMDLFVGLKKLDAQGEEVLFQGFGGVNPNDVVSRGWLRVSHRELDPKRSRPEQPFLLHERLLPLSPGEVVPVDIEILPTATQFEAGNTLRVVIQGQRIEPDAPLLAFDRPVNKGKHIIHAGGRYDSHLLIPLVE
ncbi:hypothetical protein CBS101457_001314 [Exobasidium rhododendri]|nr:hypothetical protein CBS101457_001314 [Exobasidium rhododendri]